VADRLLQPVDAFLVKRTATFARVHETERLIVVDHDRDRVAHAFLHGVQRRKILLQRRIAEPQLDGAEPG